MSLVSLNDQSSHIPSFDGSWLKYVLVVKVETLDSVEHIYNFLLLLVFRETRVVLGWPILKLELFSIGKQTHDSFPFLLGEPIYRVINLKSDMVRPYFASKCFFAVIFFTLRKLFVCFLMVNVFTTAHEINSVL